MMKINSVGSWVELGGKKFFARSKAEGRFAHFLEHLKENGDLEEWNHETKTFWFEGIKRGVTSYKPDFEVKYKNGKTVWFEVKGFMDAKSKTKIKRFAKYYPCEILKVIDSSWVANNSARLKMAVLGD